MADNDEESNNMSNDTAAEDSNNSSQVQCVSEGSPGEQSTVSLNNLVSHVAVGNQCAVAGNVAGEATSTDGLAVFFHNTDEPSKEEKDSQAVTQFVDNDGLAEQNVVTSFISKAENCEAAVPTDSECATVTTELVNAITPTTTIIYVQPDGSFVEGSGLTADEQKQLVEQLAKQQLVQVSESEAARILEQSQAPKPQPTAPQQQHTGSLVPVDLQQVIDHVNKSPQTVVQVQQPHVISPKVVQRVVNEQPASYITLDTGSLLAGAGQVSLTTRPQPFTIVQNASQRLQSVAKHVALQQSQNGTRLIQQKPVETIRIQVQVPQKTETKEQVVTLLQPKPVAVTPIRGKVTTASVVSSPQVIHITPLPGQQQYILQNPGEPPIQLLLQQPTPVVTSSAAPVLHKPLVQIQPINGSPVRPPAPKVTQVAVSVPAATAVVTSTTPAAIPTTPVSTTKTTRAPSAPAPAPAPPTTAPVREKDRPRGRKRAKKPQKIQTRSGRVSRPPKHKVRDYKFIKTEDLADSHQSDSDDYSEISVEDEDEDGRKKDEDVNFNLASKAFKCDTCDKSYIGLGGLSRHYKLNPSHGSGPGSSQGAGDAPTMAEAETGEQQQSQGPGRPRGPGRPEKAHLVGRPPKRGRPGRPPKIQPPNLAEQQMQRRKARLREVLEQCSDDDLMDTVFPRLTKVMTVWEFILMKVEKARTSKAQFADVYREFELLHGQVKKMAQHHPAGQPLEVHNIEVLRSLGIIDRPCVAKPQGSAPTPPATPTGSQEGPSTKNIRHMENTKMLPPAKRFKMENRCGETNGFQISQNGLQKSQVQEVAKKEETAAQASTAAPPKQPQVPAQAQTSAPKSSTVAPTTEPMETDVGAAALESQNAPLLIESSAGEMSELSQDEGGAAVDIAEQMQELEQALGSEPVSAESPAEELRQKKPCAGGQVQEPGHDQTCMQSGGGKLLIQNSPLTSEGIAIVNVPGVVPTTAAAANTAAPIITPQGVALENVDALLGFEMDGTKKESADADAAESQHQA